MTDRETVDTLAVPGDYVITDDPAAIDRDRLFDWLSTDAYWWSGGLRRSVFDEALDNSVCLSALSASGAFVGFGRMVTDRATFAYWADVYVAPDHRGRGLGHRLTQAAIAHPAVASCRRVMLATHDAHSLYERSGFAPLAHPERFMEISNPSASA